MDIEKIKTALEIVGLLMTFLTPVILYFSRKIKNKLKPLDDLMDQWPSLKEELKKLNDINSTINTIKLELQPNGGSSIKDKINMIEEHLTLANLRWRLLNTGNPIAVFECDEKGMITFANPAMVELFGLTEEELLGKGWLKALLDQEKRQEVWQSWDDAIKQDIPYEDYFTIKNAKTGKSVKCKATAIAHRTRKNKIIGYYGTIILDNDTKERITKS